MAGSLHVLDDPTRHNFGTVSRPVKMGDIPQLFWGSPDNPALTWHGSRCADCGITVPGLAIIFALPPCVKP